MVDESAYARGKALVDANLFKGVASCPRCGTRDVYPKEDLNGEFVPRALALSAIRQALLEKGVKKKHD